MCAATREIMVSRRLSAQPAATTRKRASSEHMQSCLAKDDRLTPEVCHEEILVHVILAVAVIVIASIILIPISIVIRVHRRRGLVTPIALPLGVLPFRAKRSLSRAPPHGTLLRDLVPPVRHAPRSHLPQLREAAGATPESTSGIFTLEERGF
jgi:hypothetical protein